MGFLLSFVRLRLSFLETFQYIKRFFYPLGYFCESLRLLIQQKFLLLLLFPGFLTQLAESRESLLLFSQFFFQLRSSPGAVGISLPDCLNLICRGEFRDKPDRLFCYALLCSALLQLSRRLFQLSIPFQQLQGAVIRVPVSEGFLPDFPVLFLCFFLFHLQLFAKVRQLSEKFFHINDGKSLRIYDFLF